MNNQTDVTVIKVGVTLAGVPTKGDVAQRQANLIIAQANLVEESLVDTADYFSLMAGCSDERARVGSNVNQTNGPRFQVFGGNIIYFINVATLAGVNLGSDEDSVIRNAIDQLVSSNFKLGLHIGCAALQGVYSIYEIMLNNVEIMRKYVSSQLGNAYNNEDFESVINNIKNAVELKNLSLFTEQNLKQVIAEKVGQDYADDATELIRPNLEHKAKSIARIKRLNKATDVSVIFDKTKYGFGSFIFNDGYANMIENLVASGPDSSEKIKLARIARELIIKATLLAVPNEFIDEFIIS
jgi:hypothetical protein